jgi:membrane fusion protein (multidrug efflux system)
VRRRRRADANFKETQLKEMRPGQPATISLDTYGREYTGHVDSIAAASGARYSLLPVVPTVRIR